MNHPQHISTAAKFWYLVYCKPRQERIARENLERQNFEVYLPLTRGRRRSATGPVSVVEPLFPRYLFIHLDEYSDNWSPIRSTYGVSGLVQFGGQPARVAPELVLALQEYAGCDGIYEVPVREFATGDRVRIVDGVMAGYEGIFRARTGKERVAILLELAGSWAEVNVATGSLEHAT